MFFRQWKSFPGKTLILFFFSVFSNPESWEEEKRSPAFGSTLRFVAARDSHMPGTIRLGKFSIDLIRFFMQLGLSSVVVGGSIFEMIHRHKSLPCANFVRESVTGFSSINGVRVSKIEFDSAICPAITFEPIGSYQGVRIVFSC